MRLSMKLEAGLKRWVWIVSALMLGGCSPTGPDEGVVDLMFLLPNNHGGSIRFEVRA